MSVAPVIDKKDKPAGSETPGTVFDSILVTSMSAVTNASSKEGNLDPQTYENSLNALASSLTGTVNVSTRMLVGVNGSAEHQKLFKDLVDYKLKEQAQNGQQISVDQARADAVNDLRERSVHALRDDKDSKKKLNVLDGYWDKQKGQSEAGELAHNVFLTQWGENKPSTDNPNYEDNLNTLAAALVGGTNTQSRSVSLGLGNEELSQIYKNLITEKLKGQGSPLNLDNAIKEVEKELFQRVGDAAGNTETKKGAIVDVIKGYWERHSGKDDADGLARETYKEFVASTPPTVDQVSEIDPNANYEDNLNYVAANMAAGANLDDRTVTPLDDKRIRDAYSSLIYAKLKEQKERGEPVDLHAAYEDVKKAFFERVEHAMRDDPDAGEKMTMFENYWDKHSGQADAAGVATEAYAKFIADNTLTNNPNYEDNLNALATLIGGGVIEETRTLSGLSDPTLKTLYQNLITHKLKDGVDLDTAIKEVNDELKERQVPALKGDDIKPYKLDIIGNYWSKHGGETDAKKAADEAYAAYVEAGSPVKEGGLDDADKKELLAPSATDIMNAETSGGKSVNELYMEKLEQAYKDEPEDSDKARFLALLKAQNALSGGFGFLPYYYETKTDETIYADDPAGMSGTNFLGLVDEDKLQEKLETLAGNPDIAADTQQYLQEAVGEIKDKQGLEDRIVATMTSPTYQDELQEANLAAENGAIIRFNGDLNSLYMLNPEKAQEVQQSLAMNSTVEKLNDIFAGKDGAGIDDATMNTAIDDVVYTTIKAAVLGTYFGEASGGMMGAYDDFMDGKKVENIRKEGGAALTQAEVTKLKDARAAGQTLSVVLKDTLESSGKAGNSDWLKTLNAYDAGELDKTISDALDKNGIDKTQGSTVREMIKTLSKDGVLGTAGALASVVAGVMTLTEAGGNSAATPAERMTSAFYLLFAVSSAPQAVSTIGEPLGKLLGKNGVLQALGLDKNGADAWKGKLIPEASDAKIANPGKAATLFKDVATKVQSPAGNQALEAFNKMPAAEQRAITKTIDKMAKSMGTGFTNLSLSDKIKLFGPGLKLVANVAYLGGSLLGVYMGADAISKFDKDTTPTEKTQGALSLIAGLAWTGAAFAGGAAWAGIGAGAGAVAGTAGTVLGAVGIVLSVIGLGIASAIKYDKQKKAADEVREILTDLGNEGVMEADWGTKFNYLANVEYNYVSLDKPEMTDEWYEYYFPEDMPVWEAQPEQYKEFTEKNGETTKFWWFSDGPELVGHGEEPDGPKYKEQPTQPSDYKR